MKKTALIIAVLVALACAVRLVIAFNTHIISSDGPFYLSVAKDFARGDFHNALVKQTFHQLYPLSIAVASKLISNWEWAGMLVSIILSSLGIIPVYFISRKYFSEAIAITACLLYCFHPQGAQLSASIFTTGMHISILLFTLWVTISALETGRNLYFILSGVLSFAMYLNRPDGLACLGITLLGIMFLSAVSWKEKSIKAIYLFIPWLLMLVPYLIAVESATGVFGLTGKVSAEAVTDMGITKSFGGLYEFIVDFIKGANPILFLLFLIGAIKKKDGNPVRSPLFIWLVFAGFMAFFAVYALTHGRMSKRYTVPMFLMMLPWVSAGIYYLGEKISTKHMERVVYAMVIILLTILSLFTFKSVGKDKIIEKTTGELLKTYHASRGEAANQHPVVITALSRITYYAGGINVMPNGWDDDNLEVGDFMKSLNDVVSQKSADYLVLDGRITRKFPDIEKEIIKSFTDDIRVGLVSQYFGGYPPPVGVGNSNGDFYQVYQFFPSSYKNRE